jgi:hypothetical protein
MIELAARHARTIFEAATPVIRIRGLGGKFWKRNTSNGPRGDRDPRIGPWLQGEYDVLNSEAWVARGACLYMVAAGAVIQYVGISRNGLKDRWRTSPAYDAETMQRLPVNQLFHSQCWRRIGEATQKTPGITFEVRSIGAPTLIPVLERIGAPISSLVMFGDDGESIVAGVERWLCNHSSPQLASWNSAMTARKK